MAASERETTWVDGPTAVAIVEVASVRNIERLVDEGLVGVRRLPGVRARYRREDLENLAKLSAVPARRPSEPRPA